MSLAFQTSLEFSAAVDAGEDGEALIVDLDGFEGPLDVLLALARAQKVDLLKLSVTRQADQYLAFVREARRRRFALAADYLVMAAWLAYLKSRLLLPKPAAAGEDELSAEEQAGLLAFRLVKLDAMRRAAEALETRPILRRDVFPRGDPEAAKIVSKRPFEGDLYELMTAYVAQRRRREERRYRPPSPATFRLDEAREHLKALLPVLTRWTALSGVAPGRTAEGPSRASLIASTLSAGLELVREGALEARQLVAFEEIYLRGRKRRGVTGVFAAERMVEALLFAAAEPLSAADLAERLPADVDVGAALSSLKARYAGRGVELTCVADRWRLQTAEDLAFLMTRERVEPRRLGRAARETLAIVAYHQPVTRAEIDAIRGVQANRGSLDQLLELGLVKMRGRRRSPGRPVTFGTTDAFLEHYGLASLADLPGAAEMKAAGLLSLDLPEGFDIGAPGAAADEDPLEVGAEFHVDYLDEDGEG